MTYASYCSSVNQCEGVTLTHALCITSLTPLLTCPFIRHTCGFVSFAYFHAPPARTTPPMQRSSETWKLSTCSRLWQKKFFFFFFLHQLELGAAARGFPKRGPRTTHGSPERLPGEHKLEFAGVFFFTPHLSPFWKIVFWSQVFHCSLYSTVMQLNHNQQQYILTLQFLMTQSLIGLQPASRWAPNWYVSESFESQLEEFGSPSETNLSCSAMQRRLGCTARPEKQPTWHKKL